MRSVKFLDSTTQPPVGEAGGNKYLVPFIRRKFRAWVPADDASRIDENGYSISISLSMRNQSFDGWSLRKVNLIDG